MKTCPCCGQDVNDTGKPFYLAWMDGLRNQDRILLKAIISAYPDGLPVETLIEKVYGGRPDGGPDTARNVVFCRLTHIRKVLLGSGWHLPRAHEWHGRYRLERTGGAPG